MIDISNTYFGCPPQKSAIKHQFQKLDKDKNSPILISNDEIKNNNGFFVFRKHNLIFLKFFLILYT